MSCYGSGTLFCFSQKEKSLELKFWTSKHCHTFPADIVEDLNPVPMGLFFLQTVFVSKKPLPADQIAKPLPDTILTEKFVSGIAIPAKSKTMFRRFMNYA
jgi:hypothetical protein